MRIFIISISLIFISVYGCIDNEVDMNRRDYEIQNKTDFLVNIKFYSRINGIANNQTSKLLNKDEKLSEKIELTIEFDDSENYPSLAYSADSVKIIFNNEKFLTKTYNTVNEIFSEPINRNLFRHSNYEHLGNEKYLFKITQQDYENAEDCNGNCD